MCSIQTVSTYSSAAFPSFNKLLLRFDVFLPGLDPAFKLQLSFRASERTPVVVSEFFLGQDDEHFAQFAIRARPLDPNPTDFHDRYIQERFRPIARIVKLDVKRITITHNTAFRGGHCFAIVSKCFSTATVEVTVTATWTPPISIIPSARDTSEDGEEAIKFGEEAIEVEEDAVDVGEDTIEVGEDAIEVEEDAMGSCDEE